MNKVSMLAVVREIDILLLAVLLIGACAAKAWYALRMTTAGAETKATVAFPLMPRRCAVIALCTIEFALGAALLLTAGGAWAGKPALAARVAVALLFGTAAGALYVLRASRPDVGCGCFGELSRTPVGWRVVVRAELLFLAALSSVGARPFHMPGSAGQAWFALAVIVGELAVLCALSPEVGQLMVRLSHKAPCEVREVPVSRTLSALRASALWRRYRRFLVVTAPVDIWREGCWRFVVYAGVLANRRVDVVFAVHLAGRGVPVRVGMLDSGTDLVVPSQAAEPSLELSKLI